MLLKLSLQRNFPHTMYVFTNERSKCDLMKQLQVKVQEIEYSIAGSMIIVESAANFNLIEPYCN